MPGARGRKNGGLFVGRKIPQFRLRILARHEKSGLRKRGAAYEGFGCGNLRTVLFGCEGLSSAGVPQITGYLVSEPQEDAGAAFLSGIDP